MLIYYSSYVKIKQKGDSIMDHSKKAVELFKSGYNCSQAVFGAYAEELGLSLDTAMKISSSFGGGMGRLREVCGTLTGSFMVLGMLEGEYEPKDNKSKAEHYKNIQELAEKFRKQNGSIICRELLGLSQKGADNPVPEPRTDTYYKKRPCVELVELAAKNIDERYFSENENKE